MGINTIIGLINSLGAVNKKARSVAASEIAGILVRGMGGEDGMFLNPGAGKYCPQILGLIGGDPLRGKDSGYLCSQRKSTSCMVNVFLLYRFLTRHK